MQTVSLYVSVSCCGAIWGEPLKQVGDKPIERFHWLLLCLLYSIHSPVLVYPSLSSRWFGVGYEPILATSLIWAHLIGLCLIWLSQRNIYLISGAPVAKKSSTNIKKPDKPAAKKWTPQDEAARKIQTKIRQFLAKCKLLKLKKEKKDYEELMDRLEKEVIIANNLSYSFIFQCF